MFTTLTVETLTWPSMLFYFIIYSFGGWLLENTHSKITTGTFRKKGFLQGPFKPMYGIAPVLVLLLLPLYPHFSFLLLLAILVPSMVEFISGALLHKLFHKKWWDYSEYRFQVRGHVCMRYSIYWVLLSLLVYYFVHPIVSVMYLVLYPVWLQLCPFMMMLFFADVGVTFRIFRKQMGRSVIGRE
ncbi:putative ABC transporter permease [Paenibacillus sp. N1-5-1-14]|uniref:putative ABC transporter permease n=1 Tax=Paenibacillus radicibacter TaxID=2972488 RepID=UPI002159906F|nr:putative ABC transporter permease [Paenibacillus radicibacter]MCR8643519.1 putative ABC transporter permease [Paenibacillus radicibacter]